MSLRSEVIRIYNELIAGAKKISELPAAGALDGTELTEVVQGGVNVKTTTQDIADLGGGGGGGGWAITGTTNLTGNVEINGGTDKDVVFNALNDFNVSTNGNINLTPTGTLNVNGTLGTNIPMGGNKVTGLAAASGNGEAVRYEQLVLKMDLNITANRQTASYPLVLADAGKLVEMNVGSANDLTVPLNSSVAFPVGTQILISQYGAGQTTVVATGGVTIRSSGGKLKLTGQYSGATLVKVATDEWYLFGDITA